MNPLNSQAVKYLLESDSIVQPLKLAKKKKKQANAKNTIANLDGLQRPENRQNVGLETMTNQLDPNQPNAKLCQGQNWLKTGFSCTRG